MVSTIQASCTWPIKRVCSVFDPLTVAYLGFHFEGGQINFRTFRINAFARGVRRLAPPENFFKKGAIWCVLEYILLQLCKNVYFLYKNHRYCITAHHI